MVEINSTSAIIPIIFDSLKSMSGAATLVKLGQAVGIVVLVYLVFLIIRAITDILASLRFRKMNKNIAQINDKMDIIIASLGSKSKARKK